MAQICEAEVMLHVKPTIVPALSVWNARYELAKIAVRMLSVHQARYICIAPAPIPLAIYAIDPHSGRND